jgi:hypothetical protein
MNQGDRSLSLYAKTLARCRDLCATGRSEMPHFRLTAVVRRGVIAGAAGGVAEIVWIVLYAFATGSSAANVAQAVTAAAGMNGVLPAAPAFLGVLVHMTLAVLLGIALAGLWQMLCDARFSQTGMALSVVASLAGIWAVNFFVVLPLVSPSFVHLLPYPVTLISKILFGAAAAASLWLAVPGTAPVYRLVRQPIT